MTTFVVIFFLKITEMQLVRSTEVPYVVKYKVRKMAKSLSLLFGLLNKKKLPLLTFWGLNKTFSRLLFVHHTNILKDPSEKTHLLP